MKWHNAQKKVTEEFKQRGGSLPSVMKTHCHVSMTTTNLDHVKSVRRQDEESAVMYNAGRRKAPVHSSEKCLRLPGRESSGGDGALTAGAPLAHIWVEEGVGAQQTPHTHTHKPSSLQRREA